MATLTLGKDAQSYVAQRLGIETPDVRMSRMSPEEAHRSRARLTTTFRQRLAELYPAVFAPQGKPPTAPLKIGIHIDLRARHRDLASLATLAATMRRITREPAYLALLIEGAVRVDLDGNPAGIVTAQQAQIARDRLQHLDHRRKTS